MILPGETEAGTAGTQPCRGISRRAHRDDERGVRARSCAAQPPSDRKTPCLENPRPKGGILTNGERRSPFQAEPRQECSLNSLCLLRGAFTLSKLVLFVIGSPAQFRDRFRSLSNVNRSGSQNASKNAAAAAEKTE